MCHYSCFAFRVVSFGLAKTSKLSVLPFRETTETNLFVSDSVKVISVLSLKGVSHEIFRALFLHVLIEIGLYKNL